MSYPVPLLPPDVLWLSHGADLADSLEARLHPRLKAHGYGVKRLTDNPNPLAQAQAVFHDVRTLLRETDGATALWARANGHDKARIVSLVELPSPHSVDARAWLGAPSMASRWRIFSLHAHLMDDCPFLASLYRSAVADALNGADTTLSEDKLARFQTEADELRERGHLPVAVDVRGFIAPFGATPDLAYSA